jgi:hypothetical protein
MRSKLAIAFAMGVAVIALSGCTTTVGLLPPDNLYPKALTFCADDPKVPTRPAPGQPRTDAQRQTTSRTCTERMSIAPTPSRAGGIAGTVMSSSTTPRPKATCATFGMP